MGVFPGIDNLTGYSKMSINKLTSALRRIFGSDLIDLGSDTFRVGCANYADYSIRRIALVADSMDQSQIDTILGCWSE